mmetsp:Transcript_10490/g.21696  ORF Transcript_10490/g.21696 Transcript_10490/m.21696 type:complete len:201 (+) Transcript_10490:76-678(+)
MDLMFGSCFWPAVWTTLLMLFRGAAASHTEMPRMEWFNLSWSQVRHLLPPEAPLLHVGCGTSFWPEEMAADGLDAVHADVSVALVADLRRQRPELRFEAADARALPFTGGEFGVVVEKGMLDALLRTSPAEAAAAAAELRRALRPGGALLSFTALGAALRDAEVLSEASCASQVFKELLPTAGDGPWRAQVGAHICIKAS